MGRRLVPALPGGGSRCGARTPSLDSPASTCASRCGAPTTIAGWSRRCAGCWSVWPRWAVGDRAAGAGPAAGALGIRRAVGGRPGVAVPVRVLGGARRRTRLGAYLARPSGRAPVHAHRPWRPPARGIRGPASAGGGHADRRAGDEVPASRGGRCPVGGDRRRRPRPCGRRHPATRVGAELALAVLEAVRSGAVSDRTVTAPPSRPDSTG